MHALFDVLGKSDTCLLFYLPIDDPSGKNSKQTDVLDSRILEVLHQNRLAEEVLLCEVLVKETLIADDEDIEEHFVFIFLILLWIHVVRVDPIAILQATDAEVVRLLLPKAPLPLIARDV